jgi:hypothetical protein
MFTNIVDSFDYLFLVQGGLVKYLMFSKNLHGFIIEKCSSLLFRDLRSLELEIALIAYPGIRSYRISIKRLRSAYIYFQAIKVSRRLAVFISLNGHIKKNPFKPQRLCY